LLVSAFYIVYAPNCIESVVISLGAAAIGAVCTFASPDFGVMGVFERFNQASPKVLFTANAVFYNGKVHDHLEKAFQVSKGLNSLNAIVMLEFIKDHGPVLDQFPTKMHIASNIDCSTLSF
jgi:acetoacetyl-CoA synthetase